MSEKREEMDMHQESNLGQRRRPAKARRRLGRAIAGLALAMLLVSQAPLGGIGIAAAQGCGGGTTNAKKVQSVPQEQWRLNDKTAGSLHVVLMTDTVTVVVAYGHGCALTIGSLRGIDTATGKVLWSIGSSSTILQDRPVGIGNVVYLPHLTVKHGDATSYYVRAIDAATGKTLWQHKESLNDSSNVAGGTDDLTLLVKSSNDGSTVTAVDPTSGTTQWTASFEGLVQRTYLDPVGSLIYTIEGNAVEPNDAVALDPATGAEVWRVPAAQANGTTAVAATEAGFIITGDGNVSLLAAEDGATAWSIPATGAAGTSTSYTVAGDLFVAVESGSDTAHVSAVGLDDGQEHWSADLDAKASPLMHPLAAGDRFIVGASNGSDASDEQPTMDLTVFDLATGEIAWNDADVASGIAVGDDAVYVPSADGEISALAIEDGSVQWSVAPPNLTTPVVDAVGHGLVFVGAPVGKGATLIALGQ
jgi:outer membrane protein assembly factor BamB